ncbi:Protein of unknown function [Cotesia congregata]|uniref:Uncharacterized protein n=1 Tax=Cotesia congregata TaxID=51543 RepID=A0A8J2H8C4_COTCN|nr:Protein of unknown function [Cotesia congregata]
MDKETCKTAVNILPGLKCTKKKYDSDFLLNNIYKTTIKEKCIFNKKQTLHAVENYSIDEMHDFREGVGNDDMIVTSKKSKFYTFPFTKLNDRLIPNVTIAKYTLHISEQSGSVINFSGIQPESKHTNLTLYVTVGKSRGD